MQTNTTSASSSTFYSLFLHLTRHKIEKKGKKNDGSLMAWTIFNHLQQTRVRNPLILNLILSASTSQ